MDDEKTLGTFEELMTMIEIHRTDMTIREMLNAFLAESGLPIIEEEYFETRIREVSWLTLYLESYAANFFSLEERDNFMRLMKRGGKFIDLYRPNVIVEQGREFYHAFLLRIPPSMGSDMILSVTAFCRELLPWMARNLFCTEREARSLSEEMERYTKLVDQSLRFSRSLHEAIFHFENIDQSPDAIRDVFRIQPAEEPSILLTASDKRVFSTDLPPEFHAGIQAYDQWEIQAELRPIPDGTDEGIIRVHPIRFGKLLPPFPEDLQRLGRYP